MHPLTFVFDIDDTLTIHFEPNWWEEKTRDAVRIYGKEFVERHKVMASGYPHLVLPGMPELWRWLEAQGHRLRIFSSAVPDRNREFIDGFVKLAFGERADEVLPLVRIFSRGDCTFAGNGDEIQERYQPNLFLGKYKKVLSGVVIPPSELPWTLLIDDDPSYMPRTEIPNFVHVKMGGCHFHPVPHRDGNLVYWTFGEFAFCYKAFYLAGFFQTVFDMIAADPGMTAAKAAKALQIDCSEDRAEEGSDELFTDNFDYETDKDTRYYWKGENILRGINPETEIPRKALRYVPPKYPLPKEWGITQSPKYDD